MVPKEVLMLRKIEASKPAMANRQLLKSFSMISVFDGVNYAGFADDDEEDNNRQLASKPSESAQRLNFPFHFMPPRHASFSREAKLRRGCCCLLGFFRRILQFRGDGSVSAAGGWKAEHFETTSMLVKNWVFRHCCQAAMPFHLPRQNWADEAVYQKLVNEA